MPAAWVLSTYVRMVESRFTGMVAVRELHLEIVIPSIPRVTFDALPTKMVKGWIAGGEYLVRLDKHARMR